MVGVCLNKKEKYVKVSKILLVLQKCKIIMVLKNCWFCQFDSNIEFYSIAPCTVFALYLLCFIFGINPLLLFFIALSLSLENFWYNKVRRSIERSPMLKLQYFKLLNFNSGSWFNLYFWGANNILVDCCMVLIFLYMFNNNLYPCKRPEIKMKLKKGYFLKWMKTFDSE